MTLMRQVVHRAYGRPADVVEIDRVDVPVPGAGEVLVELEAAPIHPAELLMFEGRYGYGPSVRPLPRKAGTEGVGRVVDGPLNGTRVAVTGAVWSDYCVLPEAHAVPLPDGVARDQLAMGVVNPQSALLLLADFADLRPGDWVVQNAANSAVGRILDAVARRRGVHVVNVVRSTDAAERLPTASPVLVDGPDLPERVTEATGDGAVLAIDAVGGTATDRLARALREGGTVVNYGLLSGEPCVLDPALCVFHGITLTGFWMPRSLRVRTPGERAALMREALVLLAEGAFSVPVERTYPLDEVAKAVEHAERAGRHGKILLTR